MALTSLLSLTLMATAIGLTMARRSKVLPRDCSEIQGKKSKVYSINPDGKKPFKVYCDMKTDGGGWTVFQRRKGEKKFVDFNRNWADYKKGFGNLKGSFWLGNDYLHRLTANRAVCLRIELSAEKWRKKRYYTTSYSYKTFAVGDENSLYKLNVSGYEGPAGGDALKYHNSMKFSTYDKDNDNSAGRNCTKHYPGGWWYNSCLRSNLNGEYLDKKVTHGPGIVWLKGKFGSVPLKFSEMKLKPVQTEIN